MPEILEPVIEPLTVRFPPIDAYPPTSKLVEMEEAPVIKVRAVDGERVKFPVGLIERFESPPIVVNLPVIASNILDEEALPLRVSWPDIEAVPSTSRFEEIEAPFEKTQNPETVSLADLDAGPLVQSSLTND